MLNAAWIDAAARFGAPPARVTIRDCSAGSIASALNGNSRIVIAAVTSLRAVKKNITATTISQLSAM